MSGDFHKVYILDMLPKLAVFFGVFPLSTILCYFFLQPLTFSFTISDCMLQDGEEYPVVLGPTLDGTNGTSFTSLRYSFKPASIDASKAGYVALDSKVPTVRCMCLPLPLSI